MTTNRQKNSTKLNQMTLLALFIAIELMMKLIGLGAVPVGPLNMSFLTVPVAVGAMLLGPVAGLIMGGVFGLSSLYDAVTGGSVMTGFFFQASPVHTVILCVGTRMLMGWCTGLIFGGLKKVKHFDTASHYVTALAAPLLNTLFFMGYIVGVFYQTEYIQNLVMKLGAANPLMFIILLVGIQGLVEAVVCAVVGGTVAKGVDKALKRK